MHVLLWPLPLLLPILLQELLLRLSLADMLVLLLLLLIYFFFKHTGRGIDITTPEMNP